MPRFDGTGPLGQGPMTGRGEGYCVFRESEQDPSHPDGFAGLQGESIRGIDQTLDRSGGEITGTPLFDITDVVEAKMATGLATSPYTNFKLPMHMGFKGLRGGLYSLGRAPLVPRALPSGDDPGFAYAAPYARWIHPLLRRRFGLHLRRGFGRGQLVRKGRLAH